MTKIPEREFEFKTWRALVRKQTIVLLNFQNFYTEPLKLHFKVKKSISCDEVNKEAIMEKIKPIFPVLCSPDYPGYSVWHISDLPVGVMRGPQRWDARAALTSSGLITNGFWRPVSEDDILFYTPVRDRDFAVVADVDMRKHLDEPSPALSKTTDMLITSTGEAYAPTTCTPWLEDVVLARQLGAVNGEQCGYQDQALEDRSAAWSRVLRAKQANAREQEKWTSPNVYVQPMFDEWE